MAAMAGHTILFDHRLMLDPVTVNLAFYFRMAIETNLAWLILDEMGLIGAVHSMAGKTLVFGKGRMGCFCHLLVSQFFMAGEAEFSLVSCNLEEAGLLAAMRSVAARTFSTGKGGMLTEKTLFRLKRSMAVKTEG